MSESDLEGRIRSLALTRPQREVAETIRQRLDDAAPWIAARRARVEQAQGRLQRPMSTAMRVLPLGAPPGFADVDQERLDRALLIDGHRGEGKTSVLMKMLDTWNQHALARLDPGHTSKHVKNKTRKKGQAFDVARPEHVFVVPLPTLDLPAMPRGGDVPLASLVLNCWSPLVTELLDESRRHGHDRREHGHGHSAGGPPHEGLRERWDWLHRSLASKYSHASKRAKDDFLQYAREMQDDTRRVYEIDDRFRLFIDALSDAVQRYFGVGTSPVFVVAIDDLDLAAHATTDLLDVLRVFQHPAVFFVMTGDYENLHRAVIRSPAAKALFGKRAIDVPAERRRAVELSVDVVERLFPRRNVLRLRHELPSLLDVQWKTDDAQTVRNLLVSLSDKLPAFAALKDPAKSDDETVSSICELLPRQMRRLVALCGRLDDLLRSHKTTADELLFTFWESLLSSRGMTVDEGPLHRLLELRWDSDGVASLVFARGRFDVDAPRRPRVVDRGYSIFELASDVRPVRKLSDEHEKALEEVDLTSAFYGLVDVGQSIASGSLRFDEFRETSFVRSVFSKNGKPAAIVWPVPRWDSAGWRRMRLRWRDWVRNGRLMRAVEDGLISVLDLYVASVGFAATGHHEWANLSETVSKTTASALPAALRTVLGENWSRLQRIVEGEATTNPLYDWAVGSLPALFSEIGWDTATNIASYRFLEEVVRKTGLRTATAEWRELESEATPHATSSLLAPKEIHFPWQRYQRVDEHGSPQILQRVLPQNPRLHAPVIVLEFGEYLRPKSREKIRARIEELVALNPEFASRVARLPAELPLQAALSELRVAAEMTLGRALTVGRDWSQYSKSLEIVTGAGGPYSKSERLLACSVSFESAPEAAWTGLMHDMLFDANEVEIPKDLPTIVGWPGMLTQDGIPFWFSPAFCTPFDTALLATGWNKYELFRGSQLLSSVVAWIGLAKRVYSKRDANDDDVVARAANSADAKLNPYLDAIYSDLAEGIDSHRARAWRNFLEASVLFASPEAGLDPPDAARLLHSWQRAFATGGNALTLRVRRVFDQFYRAPERIAGARAVAAKVRKLQPTHPWDEAFPGLSTLHLSTPSR